MDFFRVLSRKNLAMFPAYTIFAQAKHRRKRQYLCDVIIMPFLRNVVFSTNEITFRDYIL